MYLKNKMIEFSTPYPADSQLLFRLSLAYKRSFAYPMDSMKFLTTDLMFPSDYIRAAHVCQGDLSGRLWDFWSMCQFVNLPCFDKKRYEELTEAILASANADGGFGTPYSHPLGANTATAVVEGLCRCFELTKDERLIPFINRYTQAILEDKPNFLVAFGGPSLAELYYHTCNAELLAFGKEAAQKCWDDCQKHPNFHMHSVLRGMTGYQMLAMLTGDVSYAEIPEKMRKMIQQTAQIAGGDICEWYPFSILNEGCSTSDWLRVNLNAGHLLGDSEAFENAENTLWNALLLLQGNNGGFGHRVVGQNGYPGGKYIEAWWCCLHNAGRTIAECYLGTVTRRKSDDTVCVNFLIPGTYKLEESDICVEIETEYPYTANTKIKITGLKENQNVHVRIPKYMRKANMETVRDGSFAEITLSGKIGYTVEQEDGGYVLRYGPLVLAPTILGYEPEIYRKNALLQGIYTDVKWESSSSLMQDRKRLKLLIPSADEDGFLPLTYAGFDRWAYADEGAYCQDSKACVSTYVKVELSDGNIGEFCFYPINYFARGNSFGDIITVFDM